MATLTHQQWMNLHKNATFLRTRTHLEEIWENVEIAGMTLNMIRLFRNYINWPAQYYILRDMWDRWSLSDQTFFKEFRKEVEMVTEYWGEFGRLTGITHEY